MPISKEILKNNLNKYFIETGTFIGNGVRRAYEVGFENIYTIELQHRLLEQAKANLKDIKNENINFYEGDSKEVLSKILSKIKDKSTIALDAHIDGGNYVKGVTPEIKKCPLIEELVIIKNHFIKEHTIIVDDINILGNIGWGKNIILDTIIEKIKEINPDYKIYYSDDKKVMVAKI